MGEASFGAHSLAVYQTDSIPVTKTPSRRSATGSSSGDLERLTENLLTALTRTTIRN